MGMLDLWKIGMLEMWKYSVLNGYALNVEILSEWDKQGEWGAVIIACVKLGMLEMC